jgi:hypothetical protein
MAGPGLGREAILFCSETVMPTGLVTPVDENMPTAVKRAEPVGCVLRTKRWRVRRALRWVAFGVFDC